CFGRAGCSLVHDHPGKVVAEGTALAVGPWPDGTWRYDLGLLELMFAVSLMTAIYLLGKPLERKPGWLVGIVVLAYAPFRFFLDFLRADEKARSVIPTPDARYSGLTTAQWFCIAFALIGMYLVFFRRPRPNDLAYAKDSERRKREAEAAEKDKADKPKARPKPSEEETKPVATGGDDDARAD
ncbi:MAG TPA: prolipoprotein diacylglyceryl transferase family protein, partial [Nannocystaceae bacterium]|nr:prolipoprotein diacylglyceryl transferase family protein [Nannocystaceae bacterium]